MNFSEYLRSLGLNENQHLIIHSSFKKIFSVFSPIKPEDVIESLKSIVTESGSIIFP